MRVKLSYLLIFVLGILVLPLTVNAQTATSASDIKKQMTDLKIDRKNAISQIRQKTKEEIKTLRSQFKERLQTIKDLKKQTITQKLDVDISSANRKHTARFGEVLTRLQKALDKIKVDAADPKTLSEIKAAQAKIDIAKGAVASQSAKEYAIEIIDETTLRKNVGETISQFRNDLMQAHRLVVDARQAVQALMSNKILMKKDASGSAGL